MAWPKRHTRKIHISGEEFLWHLSGNTIFGRERVVTVGKEKGKHVLLIDPYQHDFSIQPSEIKKATEWALENGWSPESGPTRNMAFSTKEQKFMWLPEGTKFEYKMRSQQGSSHNVG